MVKRHGREQSEKKKSRDVDLKNGKYWLTIVSNTEQARPISRPWILWGNVVCGKHQELLPDYVFVLGGQRKCYFV